MNKSYFLPSYMFFTIFYIITLDTGYLVLRQVLAWALFFIFFGLSSSSAAFSVALVAALPTAQSLSQPQHVSRRWLELGQRWSIAGEGGDWGWCGLSVCLSVCVVCVWCEEEEDREAAGGAHRFVFVRTFVRFVCSLALAVVLFWVALRLCCCCWCCFCCSCCPC